ncbi:MAG TPA: DNA methyltransferase, partial [Nitrososphaeraceae archaeon]|nr:DNA methyltransferase [Nitrososphaeraceae archaeon]
MYNIEDVKDTILCGDANEILSTLPDESIRLAICSPPYWHTRDYKLGSDELGHEKSVDDYISRLCNIFHKVKDVLTRDGSLWVVIGDKIDGDMAGVPERFVLEMQKHGWIRRRTIIWHKPSCKPQSVHNAFTVDFEYFYW